MVTAADQQPPCGFQADIAYATKTSSNICSNKGNKFHLFISAECLAQILKSFVGFLNDSSDFTL